MTEFYVYKYFDPIREEYIYIGKGRGFRSKHHLRRKDKHPMTQRISWIREQGAEPIIELNYFDTEEQSITEEIRLIADIGRKDLNKGPLLNLTDGGDGKSGRKHSEETKKKISETRKGKGHSLSEEHKRAIGDAHRGKSIIMTEAVRQKMSEAKLGKKRKPFTDETRAKMRESSRKRWQKVNNNEQP